MLKIKDNVDLKELEKYGFKYTSGEDWHKYYGYGYDMSVSLGDNQEINIECDDCYYNVAINECIETLYDLIKDGLVEKVENEL